MMRTKNSWPLRACTLAAAGLLSACAAGPDYQRPPGPEADRFTPAPMAERLSAGTQAAEQHLALGVEVPARWWELFKSKPLDDLVRAALAHNPNLLAAQAALRVAQENTLAQQAAYFPSLGASYNASRQKVAGTLASGAASGDSYYSLHTAQLAVSYTPDVFGANRRQVESQAAQAQNQAWNLEAAYLALAGNVVLAAIQQAALSEQLELSRQGVEIQRQILTRYGRLLELGHIAHTDLIQQQALLASLELSIPALEKQLAQQGNLLRALSGRLPGQASSDRVEPAFLLDQLQLPSELPLTLPSQLVNRRPDVLAAEAQLRAASAGIGIAEAARLPSISLGVDAWGSSALSLGSLFGAGTGFWSLAAGISQPLFDAGGLKHKALAARAAYDEAAAQYQATVINAFQNVADSLQALQFDANSLRVAMDAQTAARRTLEINRRQLELGDVGGLSVMLARQNEVQSRVALAQAQATRLSDSAALFQALGGGWWSREQASPVAANP